MFNSKTPKKDKWAHILLGFFSFLVISLFLFFLGLLVFKGMNSLSLSFFLDAPLKSGRAGGINSILVSTFLLILVCMGASLPIGLGAAIYLAEIDQGTSRMKKFESFIRLSLNVLAAAPSIVFGLFGNAFFCNYLGMGFSIWSGGLTLACMVLPLFISCVEEGLRAVPQDYQTAAAALSLSRLTTLRKIILPIAMPAILAAFLLCVCRALSETAALVFTSGYVDRMPSSLSDSGRSLSVHIYDLSMNVVGGDENAYKSAFVLLIFVLGISTLSNFFAKYVLQLNTKRIL